MLLGRKSCALTISYSFWPSGKLYPTIVIRVKVTSSIPSGMRGRLLQVAQLSYGVGQVD